MAGSREVVIKISGMMCNGCEDTVTKAIKEIDGVIEASASHTEGKAHVTYDPEKTDPLFINMAVNNTHYKVIE